ncbi:MAG: DNA methyltransferase [Verrucomicrobiota bacterium]
MIIEGENLEVLKLLSSAYRERVKCVYIDPPYNTGKDFVYSDRFAEGKSPYWEQTGVTEGGVKVDTNTDSDGRFHSNWLSMMHSRLLVARYLLRPDGVILLSIDDHEYQNLKRQNGGNDDIVMDFFGGSGTAAEAVIELNCRPLLHLPRTGAGHQQEVEPQAPPRRQVEGHLIRHAHTQRNGKIIEPSCGASPRLADAV